MNSSIKTNDISKHHPTTYPCLVIYKKPTESHIDDGLVVLKTDVETGVVVVSPKRCGKGIGYHTDQWVTKGFTKFEDTVELFND